MNNMILAAGTLGTIVATVVAFLVITLLLVALLLVVKQKLSPSGPVKIRINGEKEIEVASGSSFVINFRKCKNIFTISLWWWWNLYSV